MGDLTTVRKPIRQAAVLVCRLLHNVGNHLAPTTAASNRRQTTCRTLQKGPAAAEILVRTGAVICGGKGAHHA